MRSIATLQDVENSLREMQNQLDLLRSKNMDMSKRRISNMAPSRDQYDAVVRKELNEAIESVSFPTFDPLKNYLIVFSNTSPPSIGTNTSAPFIVKTPGKPKAIVVSALVIPSGLGCVFRPKVNGTNILNGVGTIEVPTSATSGEVFFSTDVQNLTFIEHDLVNIDVLSNGAGAACSKVTLEVWMEVI